MPETVGKIGDDDDGTQGTCARRTTGFFLSLSLSPSHSSITEIRDNNNETVPQVSLFCVGLSQHQCA